MITVYTKHVHSVAEIWCFVVSQMIIICNKYRKKETKLRQLVIKHHTVGQISDFDLFFWMLPASRRFSSSESETHLASFHVTTTDRSIRFISDSLSAANGGGASRPA